MNCSLFTNPDDVLSVVRPIDRGFPVFEECNVDLTSLLKLCNIEGQADCSRRDGTTSRVLEIGIKAELQKNKQDIHCYGDHLFNKNVEYHQKAKETLANIVDHVWNVSNVINQKQNKPPLGGHPFRKKHYGAQLQKMMGCKYSEFEAITVSSMLLYPVSTQCIPHKDKLNDEICCYDKTGCMDIVLIEETSSWIYLLQVICNFRSSVRNRCLSGSTREYNAVCRHIQEYHSRLSKNYENIFIKGRAGDDDNTSAGFVHDPNNLDDFFLDSSLPFIREEPILTEDSSSTAINTQIPKQDLLFLMIGVSRPLSLSGFLDPLFDLKGTLCYDQLMELCFMVSFMATPVVFNEALTKITSGGKESFGVHPSIDVMNYIIREIGKFQSGIKPRFSPCSNKFPDMYKRNDISIILLDVVKVLDEWCDIIDGYFGKYKPEDIPIFKLQMHMQNTINNIKNAGKCDSLDYSFFRLSIFTCMVSVLQLLKSGPHLRQLIFPFEGTASWNHISKPTSSIVMVDGQVSADTDVHKLSLDTLDDAMKTISDMLGYDTYLRDRMELNLCESVYGRTLGKVDVFKYGQRIFNLEINGVGVYKEFGYHGPWLPVPEQVRVYKFLKKKL